MEDFMGSFSKWLKQRRLSEDDQNSEFNKQIDASIAQAMVKTPSNRPPNPAMIASQVLKDPRIKQVVPKGLKPDPNQIQDKVSNTVRQNQQNQQNQQRKTTTVQSTPRIM